MADGYSKMLWQEFLVGMCEKKWRQVLYSAYNVALRPVRATIATVEKQ